MEKLKVKISFQSDPAAGGGQRPTSPEEAARLKRLAETDPGASVFSDVKREIFAPREPGAGNNDVNPPSTNKPASE